MTAWLLQITGIANDDGVLARGTRIETPAGTMVADGSAPYTITAASSSAELEGRTRIRPPPTTMPQVMYLSGEELLAALRDGSIDAVARGEIGNGEEAGASGFVVGRRGFRRIRRLRPPCRQRGDAGLYRREARLAHRRLAARLCRLARGSRCVPRAGYAVKRG